MSPCVLKLARSLRKAGALLLLLLPACTTAIRPVNPGDVMAGPGELVDGEATRQQAEARFGEPQAVYEGGHVATYPVSLDRGRLTPQQPSDQYHYTLVLVFDSRDVLVRHSIVRLR